MAKASRYSRSAQQRMHDFHLVESIAQVGHSIGPCLYAIRTEPQVIKIGYSEDVYWRLRRYGVSLSNVLAIVPGTLADERDLHRRLKPYRASGHEFYRVCQPVIDEVNAMREHLGHMLPPLVMKPKE